MKVIKGNMTPTKTLNDYIGDIIKQQEVALKGNNLEDAREMQKIIDEFFWAIKLINFWKGNKSIVSKTKKVKLLDKRNKLNYQKAELIRKDNRSLTEIAKQYDVTPATIFNVKHYKSWV